MCTLNKHKSKTEKKQKRFKEVQRNHYNILFLNSDDCQEYL